MKPLFSANQMLEAEQRVKTLKSLMPAIVDEYQLNAQFKREKFNALTKEGFTSEQAMQIVVAGGDNLTL